LTANWAANLIPFRIPQTAIARTDSNKQLIDMLRRSRLFRDYESVFTKATGPPLALRPRDYWQLEHQGKKNENPFCALLAENSATLAVCLQAHDEMIRRTGDLPHTVTCPFGLTETAVPVKLGEKTIGYLRIGQVLRHMPVKADTTKVSRELERRGAQFNGQIRKAWEKNTLIPPDKRKGGIVPPLLLATIMIGYSRPVMHLPGAGAHIKDRHYALCLIRSHTFKMLATMRPAMPIAASSLLNAITMETNVRIALIAPTLNAAHDPMMSHAKIKPNQREQQEYDQQRHQNSVVDQKTEADRT
jgi:hypothetical protein